MQFFADHGWFEASVLMADGQIYWYFYYKYEIWVWILGFLRPNVMRAAIKRCFRHTKHYKSHVPKGAMTQYIEGIDEDASGLVGN